MCTRESGCVSGSEHNKMLLFLMYISSRGGFLQESINAYSPRSRASQVNVSPSNILERDNRCEFSTSSTRSAYRKEPVELKECGIVFPALCWDRGSSCTHVFQTAHEVVADWGAGQVRCVQASPYVEEIIRAQHGVILLSVAGGGEDPIDQDGYLKRP